MTAEAGTRQEQHVTGRVWTVRLDPHGRPSCGAVKLSCSCPACAELRVPGGAAAGRRAAIGHVNTHLARIREGGGPRGEAWCACRAADCAWHTPDPTAVRRGGANPAAGAVRCGGPVLLTVYADRAGRLWRIAEMCARCAAATPDCRVLDTAPPPPRIPPAGADQAAGNPAPAREPAGSATGDAAAVFSDHAPSPSPASGAASAAGPASLPRARSGSPAAASRRTKRWGKIAQRTVPHDLEPDVLRLELIDLGDAFRAYQQRPEPDLALLAGLHERKARAFALWADVSGDGSLRHEAKRAETAAQTTREMHANRGGQVAADTVSGDGQPVERLLTRQQAVHARTVLDYAAAHAPHPEAEVRLAVLMLTLRAARAGTGNVTGQDLTGWLPDDAERVLQQLAAADWLRLPGTVAEVMASRSEDPTAITVPTLLPEQPRPFGFGKTTRARISGWAQKAVGDRKIRKKKLPATTRLLALYTAAHARPDGRLGRPEDGGLHLAQLAAFCTNVIRDIASFQARLGAQEQQIRERIDVINTSLAGIDYNPGRYIRLNAAPTPNKEVREFQHDLRACTSEALSNDADDTYTEEKFLQVKALLDRFKGRPEHTRLDKEWTSRVTDVRRWFVFSASELNREDDAEYEVHSDSGGKSGGQKEKLAYTILAASLAYQFRIDPTAPKPKTFHFVTIDEAFGRGDDPSAHFALDLFQRLGLQLLVVTPLQKLHVIEPHVTRVGYVDRPDKTRSRLNNLTIEELRAHKQAAAQQANQPPKKQS